MRRTLRTGIQLAGRPLPWLSGLRGNDHFCQDWMRPLMRPTNWQRRGGPQASSFTHRRTQNGGNTKAPLSTPDQVREMGRAT
jgi:hypothetical protein